MSLGDLHMMDDGLCDVVDGWGLGNRCVCSLVSLF